MKPLFAFALSLFLFACATEQQVQTNLIEASLVKIEVIDRYPNQKKMLTWFGSNRVTYVTYEDVKTNVSLGMARKVMVKR